MVIVKHAVVTRATVRSSRRSIDVARRTPPKSIHEIRCNLHVARLGGQGDMRLLWKDSGVGEASEKQRTEREEQEIEKENEIHD